MEKELKWTKIGPFNTWSMGKKEKRTAVQCFMNDNALDVISETWFRMRGDEAKYVDVTPPGD